MEYIDISPLITEKIAVFPGDTEFSRKVLLDFKTGNNLLLSGITATVHLGAHTDAPNHYHPDGSDIASRDLNFYMGKCQVISVSLERGKRIYPEDIKNIKIDASRIIFKTGSFPNPDNWNHDFNSLSPEIIEYLVEKKVILVGIDTPSVDPADSKDLETHNSIYKNNLAILEGVVLDEVEDGNYFLIALPLKIKEGDASPVRAILLKNQNF
jgi:arylformamidase